MLRETVCRVDGRCLLAEVMSSFPSGVGGNERGKRYDDTLRRIQKMDACR